MNTQSVYTISAGALKGPIGNSSGGHSLRDDSQKKENVQTICSSNTFLNPLPQMPVGARPFTPFLYTSTVPFSKGGLYTDAALVLYAPLTITGAASMSLYEPKQEVERCIWNILNA